MPELFSAPVLQRILDDRRRERIAAVPFFDGLRTGEIAALVDSFAGVPELHHPVWGRIKGAAAFERFVDETNGWFVSNDVSVDDLHIVATPRRGIEEVILHFDGDDGRIAMPMALAADRDENRRILELRVYFSSWPRTGRHVVRPLL